MITVMGEALIDLALASDDETVQAVPGGSALNIAVGVARLGYPAALMARISRDPFGELLRRYAIRNGVDLSAAPDADEPTAIAVAPGDAGRRPADAGVYSAAAAGWQWTSDELSWIPAATTVLHVGSLAWCAAPSATRVLHAAARVRRRGALVCMDLNVHPEVMGTPGRGHILLERAFKLADVVRASIEDIGWMYPERAPQAVAEQWLRLGPGLIVVTCGPSGAMAIRGSGSVLHRPAYPAEVIDTAGVGDAFTAALLGAMHRLGDEGKTPCALSAHDLAEVLDAAILAAAMTCERPGADPPTATELHARKHRHSCAAARD
jgi:fructokinase